MCHATGFLNPRESFSCQPFPALREVSDPVFRPDGWITPFSANKPYAKTRWIRMDGRIFDDKSHGSNSIKYRILV
jgi:hypothetical protein